jgi:hypothetical protein
MVMTAYELSVVAYNPITGPIRKTIYVVHEESLKEYNDLIKTSHAKAVKYKEAKLWVNHYNMKKWSSSVSYNYAISAHKSQGSTYNNALLMEDDMDLNGKIVERNRIKYTSYTRASEKLFIFKTVPVHELSS